MCDEVRDISNEIALIAVQGPKAVALVQSLCNRVLRLEHGRVLAEESRHLHPSQGPQEPVPSLASSAAAQ